MACFVCLLFGCYLVAVTFAWVLSVKVCLLSIGWVCIDCGYLYVDGLVDYLFDLFT